MSSHPRVQFFVLLKKDVGFLWNFIDESHNLIIIISDDIVMVLFEFLLLDPQFFLLLSITVLMLVKNFSLKLDSDLDLVDIIPK